MLEYGRCICIDKVIRDGADPRRPNAANAQQACSQSKSRKTNPSPPLVKKLSSHTL